MRACHLLIGVLAVCSLTAAFAADAPVPVPPVSAVTADETPPPAPLTADQCVALALQNNPTIRKAAQDLGIANAQADGARAAGLPTVNVSVTKYHAMQSTSMTVPGFGTVSLAPKDTLQLTVQQPLWPDTRWKAPEAIARANADAQDESLLRTQQQVTFQVRQAFYQLLGALELLDVAKSAATVAEGALKLAESTVKAGTAPMLDQFQAQAGLADAQVGVAKAENGVDLARAALAVQIGLDAGTALDIVGPTDLPAVPDAVEPLVAQALAARPEVAQLAARRAQAQAAVDAARIKRQPTLTLGAAYNKPLKGGSSISSSEGITLTLVAGYSLYNGGSAKADISVAEQQLAEIDTAKKQLDLGIGLDVRQAWMSLTNAAKQLVAATQQQTAATEALRIAEIRYREGEGIILEVEQARLKLTQAQTALAQAHYQAQTAAAQLDLAIGADAAAAATPVG
jgi:outer membrane protein